MRGKLVILGLAVALAGVSAKAQQTQVKVSTPIPADMYCSGVMSNQAPPQDTFLITGEGSDTKTTFQEGDFIYLNKGSSQGVHVGDEYSIVRSVYEPTREPWFKSQFVLMHALGKMWQDEGRVKVVVVQPNVSTAQIENSCEYMQRGDIAVPFTERVAPPLKTENQFDRFAPPDGKAKAMLVTGKYFKVSYGTDDIVYVNLGEGQGVHVGDYFRVFRYQNQENETAYQIRRIAFQIYGYGGVSKDFKWDSVPREILGEGIVVRTSANAATVLITFALKPMYAGEYVELE
ncbi:MAG: hypothetical protein WA734_17515 [Candidatus Acidiferrales bacterium]